MWTIIEQGGAEKKYTLLTQKQYIVGRKDADILVPNDPSISRKHAVISVSFDESSISKPHQLPVLILKDVSKLGTVVQGVCLKNADKEIASGDVIIFGTTGNSKYQALYEPYILTTSCISGPFKKGVKTMVAKLGGHTVNEWRKDCQLLVMCNLNVTVKVICALVSLKPIVTPQYLEDLIKAIEDKTTLPKAEGYQPPLAESQLDPSCVSFNPVKERQTLFQGKIFIFLSPKQFKKLSLVIELAGGTPMLMEEGTDDNEDDILVSPSTCVVMCDQTEASQMSQNGQKWIAHVVKFLKKHKKRPITDPEIGYAILYCSTEDNCNPDKDLPPAYLPRPEGVAQSLSQLPQHTQQQPEVLAENTEANTTVHKRTRKSSRVDVTHVDETKLDVQIKEEPVSQLPSQSAQKQTVRKRQHEEAEKGADEQPRTKKQLLEIPLKQEVFTQQGTHNTSPADAVARSTRSKDKAHSPVSVSRTTRSRSRSPAPVEEHKRTRSHRSPSPSPGVMEDKRKTPRHVKQEEKSTTQMEDFDDIPDRTTRRRNNKTMRQGEPVLDSKVASAKDVEPFGEDIEMDSIIADIETSVDAFDAVPSRKSRKQGRKAKDDAKPLELSAETDTVVHKQKPVKTEPVGEDNTVSDGVSLVYFRQKEHTKTTTDSTVKVEPSKFEKDTSGIPDLQGFLSKGKQSKGYSVKISEFSTKDENLPVSCVILEERSLLARKPAKGRDTVIQRDGNCCMWKGRSVKNFKKFKKVTHMTLDGLPTIIGGSDLVVHESKPREELEEWFRGEIQAESQQNEIDKMAMEMFDYEPPGRKRRH